MNVHSHPVESLASSIREYLRDTDPSCWCCMDYFSAYKHDTPTQRSMEKMSARRLFKLWMSEMDQRLLELIRMESRQSHRARKVYVREFQDAAATIDKLHHQGNFLAHGPNPCCCGPSRQNNTAPPPPPSPTPRRHGSAPYDRAYARFRRRHQNQNLSRGTSERNSSHPSPSPSPSLSPPPSASASASVSARSSHQAALLAQLLQRIQQQQSEHERHDNPNCSNYFNNNNIRNPWMTGQHAQAPAHQNMMYQKEPTWQCQQQDRVVPQEDDAVSNGTASTIEHTYLHLEQSGSAPQRYAFAAAPIGVQTRVEQDMNEEDDAISNSTVSAIEHTCLHPEQVGSARRRYVFVAAPVTAPTVVPADVPASVQTRVQQQDMNEKEDAWDGVSTLAPSVVQGEFVAWGPTDSGTFSWERAGVSGPVLVEYESGEQRTYASYDQFTNHGHPDGHLADNGTGGNRSVTDSHDENGDHDRVSDASNVSSGHSGDAGGSSDTSPHGPCSASAFDSPSGRSVSPLDFSTHFYNSPQSLSPSVSPSLREMVWWDDSLIVADEDE